MMANQANVRRGVRRCLILRILCQLRARAVRQGDASAAFGVLMTMLLCVVVARAHRPECLFGLVLGMTFVLGAELPCIVFMVIATL
ncbi:hypothetical protein [Xanthomonas floridensis]|uniref:Uncharacterized protein n=1 Tax=Xanthomonas floridensis TaxID=1843580 RepID=A0ABU5PTK2_9XANT|nr:hypothetical protein [Xanthomonas floridensis]MEA5122637.1 hypothetical protein [Xanthomonas floridensis]MEA5131323.1 hypothetical protein [Xanthomonas floridensis]